MRLVSSSRKTSRRPSSRWNTRGPDLSARTATEDQLAGVVGRQLEGAFAPAAAFGTTVIVHVVGVRADKS